MYFADIQCFMKKKKKLSKSLRNRFSQPAVNQCVIATLSYSTLTPLLLPSYFALGLVRVKQGMKMVF